MFGWGVLKHKSPEIGTVWDWQPPDVTFFIPTHP